MDTIREPSSALLSSTPTTGRVVRFGSTGRQVRFGPKYGNKKAEADGIKFDSRKERDRYLALKLLEKNGEVRNIRTQQTYRLVVAGLLICKYRADFVYEERRGDKWSEITEDVKGFKTPAYKLKKKLMKACTGIEVRET